MRVIDVRNVHEALPVGLHLLETEGVRRQSRAGVVLQYAEPVTTVYRRPEERVVLWEGRDYNVAFCLYEALWMLAGRDDARALDKYVHDYSERFADGPQGEQHGAYGKRWRHTFGRDQLEVIVERLRRDPEDRRCVLQMWGAEHDLDKNLRDVPCNVMATLQINPAGCLDMTVFCRSNDAFWGAYFANAFHFSLLLEYVARASGYETGVYRQVSVNLHLYEAVLAQASRIPRAADEPGQMVHPYSSGEAWPATLSADQAWNDLMISTLLEMADEGFERGAKAGGSQPFFHAALRVLEAHHLWRTLEGAERYEAPLAVLATGEQGNDMIRSMTQWIRRRQGTWLARLIREDVG